MSEGQTTAEAEAPPRQLVRDELQSALERHCGGKIKHWNRRMDIVIEDMWREAYLHGFEGPRYEAVFHEILALTQRRMNPDEYKR